MPDREKGRNKRPQSKSEMKIFKGINSWKKKTELEDKRPTSVVPSAAAACSHEAAQGSSPSTNIPLPQLPPLVVNSLTLTFIHPQRRK